MNSITERCWHLGVTREELLHEILKIPTYPGIHGDELSHDTEGISEESGERIKLVDNLIEMADEKFGPRGSRLWFKSPIESAGEKPSKLLMQGERGLQQVKNELTSASDSSTQHRASP